MKEIIAEMDDFPPIVLMTDFGLADPFAGILKGVIAQIAPRVSVIDLTHEIPAGDVRRAAITLWQAYRYFPPGTVFLCVVDPGVGSSRQPILLQSGGYTYIGPDNGLFTFVVKKEFIGWQLENAAFRLTPTSATFHGRDIFAPAAAHFARGVQASLPGQADNFGPLLADIVRLPSPRLENIASGGLRGEVLFPDRFGNLLTSLGCFQQKGEELIFSPWVGEAVGGCFPSKKVRIQLENGDSLTLLTTFDEIPNGECRNSSSARNYRSAAALIGSSGLLEIAAKGRSAATLLGLQSGAPLILTT